MNTHARNSSLHKRDLNRLYTRENFGEAYEKINERNQFWDEHQEVPLLLKKGYAVLGPEWTLEQARLINCSQKFKTFDNLGKNRERKKGSNAQF